MINVTEDNIKLLQSNLKPIRQIMRISAEDFGKILGVSKQTICNYEHGRIKMNVAYYIAIRVIINDYINDHPDNQPLRVLVNGLFKQEEFPYEK